MLMLNILAMMIIMISMILMTLALMMSKKKNNDREKSSPFECGFEPKHSARIPFSLQFFLITLIFLIFDMEITLIMPLIVTMKMNNMLSFTVISSLLIMILIMGLFHEWNQGALNWKF